MDEYDHYDDDGFDAEMFQDLQDSRPFRPNMRRRVLQRFDPENFMRESVEDRLIPLLYPDGERSVMIEATHLQQSRFFLLIVWCYTLRNCFLHNFKFW